MFEKKILDLSDFKTQKLSEEREEKVKKKEKLRKLSRKKRSRGVKIPQRHHEQLKIYGCQRK